MASSPLFPFVGLCLMSSTPFSRVILVLFSLPPFLCVHLQVSPTQVDLWPSTYAPDWLWSMSFVLLRPSLVPHLSFSSSFNQLAISRSVPGFFLLKKGFPAAGAGFRVQAQGFCWDSLDSNRLYKWFKFHSQKCLLTTLTPMAIPNILIWNHSSSLSSLSNAFSISATPQCSFLCPLSFSLTLTP